MAKINVNTTNKRHLQRVIPCFENPARSKDLVQTVITISNFFLGGLKSCLEGTQSPKAPLSLATSPEF